MREEAKLAALAFIGVEDNIEAFEEFYSRDSQASVVSLADEIGIVFVANEGDAGGIQEINGLLYLDPGMEIATEFEAALAIGAYLLYGRVPVELTGEDYKNASIFAITVIAPGMIDGLDEEPTVGELITFSKKTKIPFSALRTVFS